MTQEMTKAAAATQQPLAKEIENVLVGGDLAGLTTEQRIQYVDRMCASLGLNPLTRPFQFFTQDGKLVLYCRKDATEQLRKIHGISVHLTSEEVQGDLYVVKAVATTPEGRSDEDRGIVMVKGLAGNMLANAMKRAVTQAKRRVTLSICGLAMLDESELGSLEPATQTSPVRMPERKQATPAAPAPASPPPPPQDEDFVTLDAEVVEEPVPEGGPAPSAGITVTAVTTVKKTKNGREYDDILVTTSDGSKHRSFEGHVVKQANEFIESKKPVSLQFKDGKFGPLLADILPAQENLGL